MNIRRSLLILATILLAADLTHVYFNLSSLNILTYLAQVILIPCLLISIITAALMKEAKVGKGKGQGLVAAAVGLIGCGITFLMANQNPGFMKTLEANSMKLNESGQFSVSNMEMSQGISSYIMVFLIIFLLTMGFAFLFNHLEEKKTYAH